MSLDLRAHALANISDGSLITDAAQNILYANAAFCEMSGYAEHEILGRNCRFLQGAASDPLAIANIRDALAAGETYRGNILNYSKAGRTFWNSLTITAIRDEHGVISHYASVQRDVTLLIDLQDRARSLLEREREQRKTTQSLLRVARRVNDLSTVDDVSQAISDAASELCDTSRSAVMLWDDTAGTLAVAAQSGWPGDLAARVLAFDRSADEEPALAPSEDTAEPSLVALGGTEAMDALLREFDVEAFVSMPMAARGRFLGIVVVAWPSSAHPQQVDHSLAERLTGLAGLAAVALENARLLSEARWNATHDPLTSLPNRTVLEAALGEALEAVGTTPSRVAVLYCDVDRFKLTNDALGHAAGDVMLERIASVLRTSVRSRDIVARVGGDEFVIVLPFVTGIQDAQEVADRIRSALAAPFRVEGSNIFVELSIGIAISDLRSAGCTADGSAQLLIREADAAMYREKKASRTVNGGTA